MTGVWTALAALQWVLFAFFVSIIVGYLRYHRKMMPLISSLGWERIPDGTLVIVPAKDEEEGIGPCLERLAGLNGLQNFKVVAVDDRSTDRTKERMLEVKGRFPGIVEAVSVEKLPEGWLGKNHACWAGVQAGLQLMPDARYILFTDGDVKFHPDILAESITWMKREKIDFMTMIEHAEYEGLLEPAYLLFFGVVLVFFGTRPWLLWKPGGRNFMGNGAYLLVRREAYEATGAHRALRLEVVEDLRMGLLMRSRGYRCATAVGLHRMWRRWQPGYRGIFKGLLKNLFAAFDYSVAKALGGILVFPLIFIGPWVCLFTGFPLIGALNLLLIATFFVLGSRQSRLPWFNGFVLSPFMALTASANLATSAFLTLKNGGVSWRATLYPLADLRAHCLTVKKAFSKNGWEVGS